jgi:uridine kinase
MGKPDIKAIILEHYDRYPKMQIQDIVKLLYQNEFGVGHLITNSAASLRRIKEEYAMLQQNTLIKNNLFETIGNGLYRLNLSAVKHTNIAITTINQIFVNTGKLVMGSELGFEAKLSILQRCCQNEELPFPVNNINAYLSMLKTQGYPPISHSEQYRLAYAPAYRIVKSDYQVFFDVFHKIDLFMQTGVTVNLAIEGRSGAGKSTFASFLGRIYDCNVFHMDDFFLTSEQRTVERTNEIGGNVDYVRFKKEVIDSLLNGGQFNYKKYNCSKQDFDQTVTVIPKKLNIIEGSYSMHPMLSKYYDIKIFLHVSHEKQRKRIIQRNGKSFLARYIDDWIPKENLYLEKMHIREQSDLVIIM